MFSPPSGLGTCCAGLEPYRAVPSRTEPGPARPRPGSPRAAVGGGRAERGSRRGTSQHGSARLGSPLPPWHPSAPSATRPCTSVSASRPALPSRIPERSWSWRSSPPRPSPSPAVCPPALFPHRDEPASPRGARPGLTCSFSPRHPRSSALLCPASPGRAGGCWPWAGGTEGAGDPRQGGGSCPQVPAGQGSPARPARPLWDGGSRHSQDLSGRGSWQWQVQTKPFPSRFL